MEKKVRILNLHQPDSDHGFWLTKSYQERLNAIELLRSQYAGMTQNVQPGFQRVYRIIKQK